MSDSNSNPKPSPKVTVKQKAASASVEEVNTADTKKPSMVESAAPADKRVVVEAAFSASTIGTSNTPIVQTPPAAAPAVAAVPLSHDAQTVASMLEEYKQLLSPVIVTQSAIKHSIKIMSRICDVLCSSPHNDTRDVMWKFHQDHRDTLMREDMGLRGLRQLQAKQAMRISTVYTLYRHKILKTGLVQGDEKSRMHTSQALIMYISSKS